MSATAPTRTDYRNDINGLRAWAVAAVVLYHFGIPGFGGGFVGVDVFFVISGLLMTGIVVSGLEKGHFSILGFYMARGRRIVPALLVLCAVLLVFGWLVVPTADYKSLGLQVVSSVTFLSNVNYWLEIGYFDANSHEKWLLHTWSLAVEWQFYLVLPVALSLLWRLRPGRTVVFRAVIVGIVVSYALSVALTPTKPTGSFFMLPTRAWEMLAGGLVFFLAQRQKFTAVQKQLLEIAGFVIVVACIGAFDASVAWPGWRAALPVVGSMLVLLAARDRSPMTGNPFAQWLGTRSYSIYLWHWPITVILRYMGQFEQPVALAAGLVLTCLLGDISYRVVETKWRGYLNKMTMPRGFATLVASVAAVSAVSVLISSNNGFSGRLRPEIEIVSQEQFNTNSRRASCHISNGFESPSCVYGGSKLGVVLLGDSHANAVVTALADALPMPFGVMEWSYSACPILEGAHGANAHLNKTCSSFVDWAMKGLSKTPRDVPVVVVNRHGSYALGQNEDPSQANIPWFNFSQPFVRADPAFLKEYAQHLTAMACKLAQDRTVYLVRPIPEMGVSVPNSARAMAWGLAGC